MILTLFAQFIYVNALYWIARLYYYGFLFNEGIGLILVTHTFYPSSLSVYNKDVYSTSSRPRATERVHLNGKTSSSFCDNVSPYANGLPALDIVRLFQYVSSGFSFVWHHMTITVDRDVKPYSTNQPINLFSCMIHYFSVIVLKSH